MAKGQKSELEQSIEDDLKEMGMTAADFLDDDDLDPNSTTNHGEDDDEETTGTEGDDEDDDSGETAASRLAARRAARKPASDDDDAGGSPQDNGGDARRSGGSASDGSEGAPKDGETLPGGEVEDNSPAGMARMRRELREAKAALLEAKKTPQPAPLAEAAREAVKPGAADPATGVSANVQAKTEARTLKELGEEPNPDEDMAGYLLYNAKKNNILIAEMQQERVQERAAGLFTQALADVEDAGREFTKTVPDYPKAVAHAEREYTRAVKLMMPNVTDAQIKQALMKERIGLAIKAEKEGSSVSELIYDLAIERFGYNPEGADGEGGDQHQAYVPPRKVPAKPDLGTITRNQRRSASPLRGTGERGGPRITLAQAAEMSPAELLELPAEDLAYLETMGL